MLKICFVCLGNICRSPMAEFIMKKKLSDLNINEVYVTSRATSFEEEGNDIYPKAKRKLLSMNIPVEYHQATTLKKEDYNLYDYFICMEQKNINSALRIFGDDQKNKLIRLLDLTESPKDIADPWYTNNFDLTYQEIDKGLNEFIKLIINKKI